MDPIKPHWKIEPFYKPFPLELGGLLPEAQVAYETWGELDAGRRNAVVVLHALSGSSHAATRPHDEKPGWWEQLFAPGKSLGYDRHFIVCANLLGGCYGTTGPRSLDPRTKQPYRLRFPTITIGDMVQGVRLLLRGLDLAPETTGPLTLIGGSMGGMLVLEWAARFPSEVGWGIALCTPGRSFPQMIAFRSVQRTAIMNDPDWQNGNYEDSRPPVKGLALARMIGMITYRSDAEFWERFHREVFDSRPHFTEGSYQVQSYLKYQGEKFVKRFDANTYLYFSRAMDLYDLTGPCASFEDGVRRLESPITLVSFSTDLLCPTYQTEEVYRLLAAAGRPVHYEVIPTPHGHDAFLIEIDALDRLLARGRPAEKR
ncbi:MAG: homoserine O-acetyltransferase [Planctomycetes bacterium]|nr:homoserine O-acetyltransferase [Planctomycetota bacterium]